MLLSIGSVFSSTNEQTAKYWTIRSVHRSTRLVLRDRYHLGPRAIFGGKLDRSAMVETVVLVACRGGLHDEEVTVMCVLPHKHEDSCLGC